MQLKSYKLQSQHAALMAHFNLSSIITIKKKASGGTEWVGRMGRCFRKDRSYQRLQIWRTFSFFFFFFIHDNVPTNIYVGECVWEILSLLEWPSFLSGCSPERWKNSGLHAWGGSRVSEGKVWATVAYKGDRRRGSSVYTRRKEMKEGQIGHCFHAP